MTKTVRVYGTVIETIEREVAFTVEVPSDIEARSLDTIAAHARMSAENYVTDGFDPDVIKEDALNCRTTNDYGKSTFSVTDVDFSGMYSGAPEAEGE